jgi:thioredoxin-dependent peroxiredoxin
MSLLSWLTEEPLQPGSPAPDFLLPDQDGNQISLKDLRGRNVVLIFYPGDDTRVCTRQLCEFRDTWKAARDRNTLVFGVNPQSAATHARFRAKRSLPFPLLVDPGRRVAKLYRASMPLIVRRTVYLIGPDGAVRFAQRGTPPPEQVLEHAIPLTA